MFTISVGNRILWVYASASSIFVHHRMTYSLTLASATCTFLYEPRDQQAVPHARLCRILPISAQRAFRDGAFRGVADGGVLVTAGVSAIFHPRLAARFLALSRRRENHRYGVHPRQVNTIPSVRLFVHLYPHSLIKMYGALVVCACFFVWAIFYAADSRRCAVIQKPLRLPWRDR